MSGASHDEDRLTRQRSRSRAFVRRLGGALLGVVVAGTLTAQGPPTLRARLVSEPIRIDGLLDEPAWKTADAIDGLTQVEPVEGGVPAGRTVVRVLVHPRFIAVGVTAWTGSRPITAFVKARDADLDDEDHITIALDPFGDGRSGYLFAVNPNGARYDAIVTNQGEGENDDWNGIWEAATSRTDSTWSVEIRIPVVTLSFPADAEEWAFNVQRRIQSALATDRWASPRRDADFRQMSLAGRLTGLPRFDLGWGLTVRPSVTAGAGRPGPGTPLDGDLDASLDVEQRLGSNLLATVTFNTDFAETEVDSRRTNLTRFPLFFPEKRTFFLEGSDVFEFGLGLGRDILPFFSRRIGLIDGTAVPVHVGAKLNGQVGSTRIGAIAARTGDGPTTPGTGLAVVRVRQNVLSESSIGAIATVGDPRGGSGWLAGADATFRTSRFLGRRNFLVGASLLRSDRAGAVGDQTALGFKIDYPNDLLDVALTYKRIGDGFEPPLGFVPRRGVQLVNLGATLAPRPDRWGIRQLSFENRLTLATDLSGRWESYQLFLAPVKIRFETGDRFEFNVAPQGERLVAPFEVSEGVVIDPGSYSFVRYRLEMETSPTRRLNGQVAWRFGGFYDGRLDEYEVELDWRPSASVGFSLRLDHATGRLPAGDFDQTVTSAEIRYNATPDLQVNTLIQYDTDSRSVGSNSRLRWTITPAAEFFVIYNHNVLNRLDRWAFESNQLLTKLQVAFRR